MESDQFDFTLGAAFKINCSILNLNALLLSSLNQTGTALSEVRRRFYAEDGERLAKLLAEEPWGALLGLGGSPAELKGSIGEGPNHSNFSDRSVRILSTFRNFR